MDAAGSSPFETVFAAVADAARARPDAPALAFPEQGQRRTYAQLRDDASALARGLLDSGLAPGDRVALLSESRVEWPTVQLACAAAGLVLVPLNTHYRTEDLGYALRRSGSRALFLSPVFRSNRYADMVESLRGDLPALRHVVPFGRDPGDGPYGALLARGRASGRTLPAVAGGEVAALLYTSGTTGFPKGALQTHRAMLGDSWGSAVRLGIGPEDRWTTMVPLFHCAGCIMVLQGAIQRGACFVGVPAFDPEAMMRVIQDERCSVFSGVPTAYIALLNHAARPGYDLSSLRIGTCGGADADPAMLERCARELPLPGLVQVYGMTETSTLVSCPAPDDPERYATSGPPLPGMEARITDPATRAVLPAGVIGQVEARGVGIMAGYDQDPAATAAVLDASGWLQTGDLGLLTPTGRLQLAGGRMRDMIIRGGENVYAAEVERVLLRHPAVREAAVFPVKDAYYGEAVAVALRLGAAVKAADLQAFCGERIARFKVPVRLYRVDAFPLTASGKVRKVALREQAEKDALPPLD